MGLTIKEATVVSQAAIVGGALSGATFALFRKHPAGPPGAPLLDYGTAFLLLPVLLLGTSVGRRPAASRCSQGGRTCEYVHRLVFDTLFA